MGVSACFEFGLHNTNHIGDDNKYKNALKNKWKYSNQVYYILRYRLMEEYPVYQIYFN